MRNELDTETYYLVATLIESNGIAEIESLLQQGLGGTAIGGLGTLYDFVAPHDFKRAIDKILCDMILEGCKLEDFLSGKSIYYLGRLAFKDDTNLFLEINRNSFLDLTFELAGLLATFSRKRSNKKGDKKGG